jgi:hypothetical protein
MKAFVPFKSVVSKLSFLFAVLTTASSAFSQIIPELVFDNAVLESGVAGEDGAKYRFSNVASGIDAVVEIKGRSSSSVILTSIDTSGAGMGYIKAFQPVLGIPGTAPSNTTWSMDFRMTFYKAGTNSSKTISEFNVTGLDIDGDGSALSEWTWMGKLRTIDSALVNSLTFIKTGSSGADEDYKVEGIIANAPGIDTTATFVMATYRYQAKSSIDFTIGAKTFLSTTSAGMRLNSLWFREFFNPPLPVKLISFTAVLNNNKADLKWTTATEINVSHFSVEKSFDGTNFSEAGVVFANGNTTNEMNYSFTDHVNEDQVSVIYYRLRSVDIDGKSELSSTRMIQIGKKSENKISILTYPNPVTNELRITIPASWQNKKVSYELFNVSGQSARKIQTAAGSQTETVDVSNMAPGFYIVRVACEGQAAQQKIIKK